MNQEAISSIFNDRQSHFDLSKRNNTELEGLKVLPIGSSKVVEALTL